MSKNRSLTSRDVKMSPFTASHSFVLERKELCAPFPTAQLILTCYSTDPHGIEGRIGLGCSDGERTEVLKCLSGQV